MSDAPTLPRPAAGSRGGRRGLRALAGHRTLLVGVALCAGIAAAAGLADLIHVQAPGRMRMRDAFAAPRRLYPFGADNLRRAAYNRAVPRAPVSLRIGLAAV